MPYPFDPEDTIGPAQENWSQVWDGHPVEDPPPDFPDLGPGDPWVQRGDPAIPVPNPWRPEDHPWMDEDELFQEDPYVKMGKSFNSFNPYLDNAWEILASDPLNAEINWNYNALNSIRDTLRNYITPGPYQQRYDEIPPWTMPTSAFDVFNYARGNNQSSVSYPYNLITKGVDSWKPLIENYSMPEYNVMMHEMAHVYGPNTGGSTSVGNLPNTEGFYNAVNALPPDELDMIRKRYDYMRRMLGAEGNEQYWNMPHERYASFAQQPYLIPESLRQYYPWINFEYNQGMIPTGDFTNPWGNPAPQRRLKTLYDPEFQSMVPTAAQRVFGNP